jgi:hypothetical protein
MGNHGGAVEAGKTSRTAPLRRTGRSLLIDLAMPFKKGEILPLSTLHESFFLDQSSLACLHRLFIIAGLFATILPQPNRQCGRKSKISVGFPAAAV